MALTSRPVIARRANVDAMVSIHSNALPDGMNPFTSHGTGTYFFQPQSIGLARDVQTGLVATMGLRDLGVHYDNLAVVRPTWMPAVLCEGAFVIIPAQEAAFARLGSKRGTRKAWRTASRRTSKGWRSDAGLSNRRRCDATPTPAPPPALGAAPSAGDSARPWRSTPGVSHRVYVQMGTRARVSRPHALDGQPASLPAARARGADLLRLSWAVVAAILVCAAQAT